MKKVVLLFLVIGLALVGLAYYFSVESKKIIEYYDKLAILKENQALAEEDARNELLYDNAIPYQSLDLSNPDYTTVRLCMKRYHANGKIDAFCSKQALKVVVDDFGELGFIKAIIGSCIDYSSFSYEYSFLKNLFHDDSSLSNKLVLSFLNRYRDPDYLNQSFKKYKNHLYQSVSKELYQTVFKKQVNELLSAYEEIGRQKNKKAFFENIYLRADTQILHDNYWKYTFWKRRELERNDGVVYTILKDVNDYYSAQ